MSRTTIDRLIINSPYEEPQRHWRYARKTLAFTRVKGYHPAKPGMRRGIRASLASQTAVGALV